MTPNLKPLLIKLLARVAECFAQESGQTPESSREIAANVTTHLQSIPEIPTLPKP